MTGRHHPENGELREELELGLTCAWQAHFADAASHFAQARDQIPATHPQLITALDAFVQSHARYWQAEQSLHEASLTFTAATAEQQTLLEDLQHLLTATGKDIENAPMLSPVAQRSAAPRDEWDGQISDGDEALPPLSITCFGRFEVRRSGRPVTLCQNRNGQTILRYLVSAPRHRATMDALIDALWPEESPDIARHKLHVAISALRRALNGEYARRKGMGYLLCENGAYQLNPEVSIRIDAEEFMGLYRVGQHKSAQEAIPHFEGACRLYTGAFLPEDLYADWSLIRREQLMQAYMTMCHALAIHYLSEEQFEEAAIWAACVLEENRCDESAYRHLMQSYAGQGRRSEALRQYQRCERVLAEELGVQPMPETETVFHTILHGDSSPAQDRPVEDERLVATAHGQEARSA
jgi:DNA-binding SARP family transcriptional activator